MAYLRDYLDELESKLEMRLDLCENLDMGLLTDEDDDENYEDEEKDFVNGEDEVMETDEMLKGFRQPRVVSFLKC